jgi:hypothetical protein
MFQTGQQSSHELARISVHRILSIAVGSVLLAFAAAPSIAQQDKSMANMPGMSDSSAKNDMGGMTPAEMKAMGPSMEAMEGHMYITSLRPAQPGDEAKVKDMVVQIRAMMERYKDYKNALADGYVIANPKVEQPQYHFINEANSAASEHHFDPTKPAALLYYKSSSQRYRLEGVMFTMPSDASEDELNARIPLSQVRWHIHENFCAAPADKIKDYQAKHPKFGMFGSINTEAACKAQGGVFYPKIFTWMIHVFPYETTMKDQFSLNDDISHFGPGN